MTRYSRVVLAPLTKSVEMAWRPQLRFYQERIAVLQALEDLRHLRAFRVHENFIEARLGDGRQYLTVRQNGLIIRVAGESLPTNQAWDIVRLATELAGSEALRHLRIQFQHVAPLRLSPEDAVRRGYGTILGQLGTPSADLSDWAVLADLTLPRVARASGVSEFGVVEPHELPRRLNRVVGRRAAEDVESPLPWDIKQFAPASLFADTYVDVAQENLPAFGGILDLWDAAEREIGNLVLNLKDRLEGDDEGRDQ